MTKTSIMTFGISAIIVMAGMMSAQPAMAQSRTGPGILSIQCNGLPVAPLNQEDISAFKKLISLFENSVLNSTQIPQGLNVETAELEVSRDSINDVGVACVFMSLRCNGDDPDQLCKNESIIAKRGPELLQEGTLGEQPQVDDNQISGTNHPPSTNDVNAETTKASPVNIQIEASDVDPNDELKVLITSDPTSGTVLVNQDTGVVTYTPDPKFTGKDSFTFKINDGIADSGIATGSITVKESAVSTGEPELLQETPLEERSQIENNPINLTNSNHTIMTIPDSANKTLTDSTNGR